MVERKPLSDDPSPKGPPSDEPAYLARRIDASAMKAFAHPLRMAMYDYLNDHESATATMLAKHTGESTGQTSYHLRQLERHGFVEEDPTRGSGRERWWKAVGFRMNGDDLAKDSETRPAVAAMLRNQVTQRAEALKDWFQRSEDEPQQWRNSSLNARTTAKLTAQEAGDLNRILMETIHEHTERAKSKRATETDDASVADDRARQFRIYLDAFPLPTDD